MATGLLLFKAARNVLTLRKGSTSNFAAANRHPLSATLGRRISGNLHRSAPAAVNSKGGTESAFGLGSAAHLLRHCAEVCVRLVERGIAAVFQHRLLFIGFHGRPGRLEVSL